MKKFSWQTDEVQTVQLANCRLEAACFGPSPARAPVIVLLHEGLGCVALWRDFPEQLALATGYGVFAYSRAGYGKSDPVTLPRPLDYMTHEAVNVLPQILEHIGFQKGVLLGHSDGASIAAIYLGSITDHRVRGMILMAPHFFTEPMQLAAIADARDSYRDGRLRDKLAKYHSNADNTFVGWNDAWLNPRFTLWDISDAIDYWRIPVLAIQGAQDQYGSMAQIEIMQQRAYCPVEVNLIDECQHSPHLQHADATLDSIVDFTARIANAENFLIAPCQ